LRERGWCGRGHSDSPRPRALRCSSSTIQWTGDQVSALRDFYFARYAMQGEVVAVRDE
jgi:hypothetical protein